MSKHSLRIIPALLLLALAAPAWGQAGPEDEEEVQMSAGGEPGGIAGEEVPEMDPASEQERATPFPYADLTSEQRASFDAALDRLERIANSDQAPPDARLFRCWAARLRRGADDRVVEWTHACPGITGGRAASTCVRSALSEYVLADAIDSVEDVESADESLHFLSRLKAYLVVLHQAGQGQAADEAMASELARVGAEVATASNRFDELAASDGGWGLAPQYVAIHEWIQRKSADTGSVMSCVAEHGSRLLETIDGTPAAQVQSRSAPPADPAHDAVLGAREVVAEASQSGTVRIIASVAPSVTTRSGEVVSRAVSAAADSLATDLRSRGADSADSLPELGLVVSEVNTQQLNQLLASGEVDAVAIDRLSEPLLAQSGPLVKATDVHASGKRGQEFSVAVMDTGVQSNHPFLRDRVVAEACFSSGPTSLCPNGNRRQLGEGAAAPCTGISSCDHGTHVAGIAAGAGSSFSGMAPDADILAVQVFSRFDTNADCRNSPPCILSYDSDQLRGLNWIMGQVEEHRVAAVNISIGGGHTRTTCNTHLLRRAIDRLWRRNVAVAIASGNDDFTDAVGFPACISRAVTVGSTDKSDVISTFSNSSVVVDLLAPGTSINSSISPTGFASFNGTSMATPHVAGSFALLRSVKPTASVSEIERALTSTGVLITDGRANCSAANGFPACLSSGIQRPRIDLAAAQLALDQANTESEAGDRFGWAVAQGDFDGDGIQDLAVGAPGEASGTGPRSGNVTLFKGSAAGLQRWASVVQDRLGQDEFDDRFGAALAAADFDGDGKDDLAVGAPGKKIDGKRSGRVYLFKGTSGGVQPWKALDQTGIGQNESGDLFGFALAAADFDRDGKADLAVGAPGEVVGTSRRSGFVFLFKGGSDVTAWRNLHQGSATRNEDGDRFGYALAAGDFDGNGSNELAVGTPTESVGSGPDAGFVFVFSFAANGSARISQGLSQALVAGEEAEPGDQFGWSLVSADFNGDGKADLAVGAPGETPGGAPPAGAVFVFPGGDRGLGNGTLLSQSGVSGESDEVGDRFGDALAAGDFDGDGKADLAVGAPGDSPAGELRAGLIFAFSGSDAGIDTSGQVFSQSGAGANELGDRFGDALASGDFNNDGKADLVIGAPGEAPGANPRSGYIYSMEGSSGGLTRIAGRGQGD